MVLLVDRALCLHRYAFSESSLVAHVLTQHHGRVHLLARGAYRTTSRFFAVIDLFDELELEWEHSPKRELQTLRAGRMVTRRRALVENLAAFEAGGTILELCDIAARHETHDAGLFAWASTALDELVEVTTTSRTPEEVLVRSELSFLQHLGLTPALEACASCGGEAPPIARVPEERAAFSAGAGGRLCRRCADEARAAGRRVGTLPVRVLEDGRDLASPDARMRPPLDARRVERVRDFVGRFLDYHLETRPRSQRAFLSAPNRNAPPREAAGRATDEPTS